MDGDDYFGKVKTNEYMSTLVESISEWREGSMQARGLKVDMNEEPASGGQNPTLETGWI